MRLLCFLSAFIVFNAPAQSVPIQLGGRSAGMGNASAALADEWAAYNNPGGLANTEEIALACAYDLRPSLEGANRMGAALTLPASYGTMAFAIFKFGDDFYNEHLATAAYGHRIGITSLGAKVNYVQYLTGLFGSHYAFSFDFGGITKLTPNLSVGCYILNLAQAKLNTVVPQPLPTRMTAGLSYEISPHVRLSAEAEKNLSFVELHLRHGMEYNFRKQFFLRTGFNLSPNAGFMGIGLHKYGLKIDYAVSYSPVLLFTSQASVVYRLKKRRT